MNKFLNYIFMLCLKINVLRKQYIVKFVLPPIFFSIILNSFLFLLMLDLGNSSLVKPIFYVQN